MVPHFALGLLLLAHSPQRAAVSYTKDIAPILLRHCSPCHYGGQSAGGLKLDTVADILRGGAHGPAIKAGHADESRLVLMMEGKLAPAMPPIPNSKPVGTVRIRAWIDAGALADSSQPAPTDAAQRPALVAGKASDPRVTCAAFSPDGSMIAAGGYQTVSLIDAKTGRVLKRLTGASASVNSLVFSPDGRSVFAAGGLPGRTGEIVIWDAKSGRRLRTLHGHSDAIYSLAISRDGKRLASASYDHSVGLWKLPAAPASPQSGQTAGPRAVKGRVPAAPDASVLGLSTPLLLRDHTDSVYGVSFNPAGTLLGSAGGDRTVKVWRVDNGKRVYTLSEAGAEVYALAFSPDGLHLAAGGVDKTLRTYAVSASAGKLERAALAHDAAILRIVYSRDGASIFTAGEDGAVKRWDAATLAEKRVYPREADWPQALALSPDGRVLAVGRHSGSLALYDAASGKLLLQPLKSATVPRTMAAALPTTSAIPGRRLGDQKQRRPVSRGAVTLMAAALGSVSPMGASRGKPVRLTLSGALINDAMGVYFDDPAISGTMVTPADPNKGVLRVDTAIGATARVGVHRVYVQSPHGTTGSVTFAVGAWPEIAEAEPNDTPDRAQAISPPCTVTGAISQPGDVDTFRYEARAGEELVFEIVAQPIRSRLQAVLTILDSSGATLAESQTHVGKQDTLLGYRFAAAGTYYVQVRDYEGAGAADLYYRLNVGEFPVVTRVSPQGLQSGTTANVRIEGYNLGGVSTVKVTAPNQASWGQVMGLPLQIPGLLSAPALAVGADPEVEQSPGNDSLARAQSVNAPVTINGSLAPPPHVEAKLANAGVSPASASATVSNYYRFSARKGEPLVVEVLARRLGSPLDSQIEILDSAGKPVERAVVRAVGRTEVTLADRDSASSGIRLVSWDDFHLDDYLMVGREVIRIAGMPKGPDDDMQFRTQRGQRLGYFGTTPEYHSIGASVYKVEVHPPGSSFSPNGYPLTHLMYENDDGGPLYGKDSYLEFTPAADGEYIVRLSDARGAEGADYFYRLMIHPPRPDFRLAMSPDHPNLPKGDGAVIDVSCERYDGFEGEIHVKLAGLPAGFTATSTTIQAGETSASILISAAPDAVTPKLTTPSPIRLLGDARIDGREVSHAVEPDNGVRLVTVMPPPDVVLTTDIREVTIHPGEEVEVEARVERVHGFGNRIPLDVKNLPHGVRVMDVGLNGILVNEDEDTRRYKLYCEPWVKPQERPFYTIANVEGGVPTAAPPLMLTIQPAGPAPRKPSVARGATQGSSVVNHVRP